jgi:hypothetical protein
MSDKPKISAREHRNHVVIVTPGGGGAVLSAQEAIVFGTEVIQEALRADANVRSLIERMRVTPPDGLTEYSEPGDPSAWTKGVGRVIYGGKT